MTATATATVFTGTPTYQQPTRARHKSPSCTALHYAHCPRSRAYTPTRNPRGTSLPPAMVDGGSGAGAPSCRSVIGPAARRCCGGGCGLGRLVRRLRRQGRQALCAAARPPSASAEALRGCQYDPLSYARNFDHTGFGDPDASSLYYSYTFSSRFVLAPAAAASSTAVAVAVAAPAGIIVAAARSTAASH